MKKSILVIVSSVYLIIQVMSCQPDPGPQPTTPTSPTTPTTPTVTPSTPTTVAGQQQMILGTWVQRQTHHITAITTNGITKDSLLAYENMYSPSTCFLEFTNTAHASAGYYVVNGSLNCGAGANYWWKISTLNQLQYLGGIYIIEHLTADSLVFYTNYSGTKTKYIFNKTGIQPSFSATESMIAGNWNVVEYITVNPGGTNISYNVYNGPGTFTNQWVSVATLSGYKTTGFNGNIWSALNWEVVEGRFNIGATHYRIDTLSATKFVISGYPQAGTNTYSRYRLER
jgi:hypothetical protein